MTTKAKMYACEYPVIGTRDAESACRAYVAADFAVRKFAAAALMSAGLADASAKLAALPPIRDRQTAAEAADIADAVSGAARAARADTAADAAAAARDAANAACGAPNTVGADAAYAAAAAEAAAEAAAAADAAAAEAGSIGPWRECLEAMLSVGCE